MQTDQSFLLLVGTPAGDSSFAMEIVYPRQWSPWLLLPGGNKPPVARDDLRIGVR